MFWIIVLSLFLCESYAQLTPPDEAVCVGEQVVFVCNQTGSTLRWTVNLPGGISNELITSSSQAGRILTFTNDPGYGFEIHVLSSSSASSVISELRVTAVRELNGVTVECAELSERFMSTIIVSRIDCGTPITGYYGVIIEPFNDTKFGSLITFYCEESNNSMTAVCGSDGEWNPRPAYYYCGYYEHNLQSTSFVGIIVGMTVAVLFLFILLTTAIIVVVVAIKKRKRCKIENKKDGSDEQMSDIELEENAAYGPIPGRNVH